MKWTVEFYEEDDGTTPVEQFLLSLSLEPRAKALAIVKLLEESGPALPFPYSSQVRGRIRELRAQRGKDKIRILYFADNRRWYILLHGLIKRSNKLNEKDIEIAEHRMQKHNERLGKRQVL